MGFPWRKVAHIGLDIGGAFVPGLAPVAAIVNQSGVLDGDPNLGTVLTALPGPLASFAPAIQVIVEIVEAHASALSGDDKQAMALAMLKVIADKAGIALDEADVKDAVTKFIAAYVAFKNAEAAAMAAKDALLKLISEAKQPKAA